MTAAIRLLPLLGAALLMTACERQPEPQNQVVADVGGPAKGVDRSKAGQPLPDVPIRDAEGEESSLAQASGEPVLVNLWATWCAPCVKELPTLQALSEKPGAPRVVAVSQDMTERDSVDRFVAQNKLTDLEVWHDREMALSGALDAQVLPTTILYGADGRELWRYVGDLDWTGPEATQLLAPVNREAAR